MAFKLENVTLNLRDCCVECVHVWMCFTGFRALTKSSVSKSKRFRNIEDRRTALFYMLTLTGLMIDASRDEQSSGLCTRNVWRNILCLVYYSHDKWFIWTHRAITICDIDGISYIMRCLANYNTGFVDEDVNYIVAGCVLHCLYWFIVIKQQYKYNKTRSVA